MTAAQIETYRDKINMYDVCRHVNIVELEDSFENQDNFYLCLEMHSEMTLHNFITTVKDDLEEVQVRNLALKIAQSLEFLHDKGVVLRNLSCHGILMSEST